jgi:hypothetical protein
MKKKKTTKRDVEEKQVKGQKILFAQEWVRVRSRRLAVDFSGAKCSSDHSKDSLAWKWLQDPAVIKEIRRLEAQLEKAAIMKAVELDAHVEALVRANPQDIVDEDGAVLPLHKLPRELAYAVAEYTVDTWFDKDGDKHMTHKVKLHNKKEATELMMKRRKLLKDQVEHSGSITHHHAERIAEARKREEAILRARKQKTSA